MFRGVKSFYECAIISYALSHLPLDDEILHNAQFVDLQKRLQADFTQVSYFVVRFSEILPYSDTKSQERLFEQFTQYQVMLDNTVPGYVWNDAKILEKDENDEQVVYYRMDMLWAYLGSMTDQVMGRSA